MVTFTGITQILVGLRQERDSSSVGFMHGKQEKTSLEQTGGHVISSVSTMQTGGEEE